MVNALTIHQIEKPAWRRLCGLIFGAAAQLLFVVTVARLYWFLAAAQEGAPASLGALAWDAAWAVFFAVPHSVLRLPTVQRWVGDRVGREFFGVLFCTLTCASLWTVTLAWRPAGPVVWQCHGVARWAATAAFHLGWIALGYSMHLAGFGYQTGYTEWSSWRRREPLPPRRFAPRGAYHWLRHPIYLSFLALIWLTPRMTLDRLVLAAVWTAYIAVGSYLKDERLAFYMGAEYRRYQQRVPGYPLMFWGPLGRRKSIVDEPPRAAPSARLAGAR